MAGVAVAAFEAGGHAAAEAGGRARAQGSGRSTGGPTAPRRGLLRAYGYGTSSVVSGTHSVHAQRPYKSESVSQLFHLINIKHDLEQKVP